MACVICGRSSCCDSFHSQEEQERFEPAILAYQKYLDVLEECRNQSQEENEGE